MKTLLKVAAALFGAFGLVQLMVATMATGSGVLAAVALLAAGVLLAMAGVLDRMDTLIAKP